MNPLLPPLTYVQKILDFIFIHNYFKFNGKTLPTMGTRMALSYANLYMASLEKLLETAPQQTQPLLWKRYIDNIFMIWQHNNTELTSFLQHINSLHPTIKFQYETSRDSINQLPRHHHTHTTDRILQIHTQHHICPTKALEIIDNDPTLSKIFPDKPMTAYTRQYPSLWDRLVRSLFTST